MGLGFLAFLLLAGALYGLRYLAHLPSLRVQGVVVEADEADTEAIERVVENSLEGSYLYLIPKNNIYFTPQDHIKQSVKDSFPSVESIQSSLSDNNHLIFSINEREAESVWCDTVTQECYLVDDDFVAFEKVDPSFSQFYTKFYYANLSLGDFVVDSIMSERLEILMANLETLSLSPREIRIDNIGDLFITLEHTEQSPITGELRLSLDDIQRQMQNLTLLIEDELLLSDEEKPAFIDDQARLEYLDLRFGNRIVYRWEGDTLDEVNPTPVNDTESVLTDEEENQETNE